MTVLLLPTAASVEGVSRRRTNCSASDSAPSLPCPHWRPRTMLRTIEQFATAYRVRLSHRGSLVLHPITGQRTAASACLTSRRLRGYPASQAILPSYYPR